MSNPYEAQEVYKTPIMRESSVFGDMIKCLKNRIASTHTVGVHDTNQPIIFLEEPIPPERSNNYESIIDYILFEGMGYTYRDLSLFSDFFAMIDWHSGITPTQIDIFNFFISLPYVVFSFERVIGRQPTARANSSAAYKFLGEHFKPIYFDLHDRNDMERLMNQYCHIYGGANHNNFKMHLLIMLQSFYFRSYKENNDISEINTEGYFKSILDSMCKFISRTSNQTLDYNEQKVIRIDPMKYIDNYPDIVTKFSIKPDLVIFDESGAAKMIIEMKRPPMFEHFNVPPFDQLMTTFHETANGGHFSTVVDDKLVGMLKKLLVYMVGLDCLRGILTDGYTLILVEIDVSKLSGTSNVNNEKDFINHIPLKLSTFNCKSRYPSYLQAILYFFMDATLDDTSFNPRELFKFEVDLRLKSIIEMDERKVEEPEPKGEQKDTTGNQKSKNRRLSDGDESIDVFDFAEGSSGSWMTLTAPSSAGSEDNAKRPLIISWEDHFEVLQNIYYALSHVVKVKAKYVKTHLLESIDDEDYVVVKIFDPTVASMKKFSREEVTEYVNEAYEREKESAQLLINTNIDTLYMKQVYGSAIFNFGFGRLIRGKFIISRYVESSDLPITKEIFDMLRQQLDIIHNAGIIHGDISESNILFDQANNKVYIIDFANPRKFSAYYNKDDDIEYLEDIFENCMI